MVAAAGHDGDSGVRRVYLSSCTAWRYTVFYKLALRLGLPRSGGMEPHSIPIYHLQWSIVARHAAHRPETQGRVRACNYPCGPRNERPRRASNPISVLYYLFCSPKMVVAG